MRRAIRHVGKTGEGASRRYVISRAKALGHTDLLPSEWLGQREAAVSDDLEKQFAEQSVRHGISVARLKCVYFRGVQDFQEKNLDFGNATMWGLVRVQRYVNAMTSGNAALCDDSDLFTVESTPVLADPGIVLSIDGGAVLTDVIYGDGSNVARLFRPGQVSEVVMSDTELSVMGMLGHDAWRYTLDTRTGEHALTFL